MTRKPVCVMVVAAFLWMATAIAVFVAIVLLIPGTLADAIWHLNPAAYQQFKAFGGASSIFLLAVGAMAATSAAGLVQGRKWAWWLAVSIFAMNGIGDIVGFVVTRDLVRSGTGVLVTTCFLLCLMRGDVRSFYRQPV